MTARGLGWVVRTGAAGLAALLACGCATVSDNAPDAAIARGREIAIASCSSCHDIGGAGPGPMPGAPGFSDPGLRHTAALPGRMATLTRKGHYAMPVRALTGPQLEDLLAYIERVGPKD